MTRIDVDKYRKMLLDERQRLESEIDALERDIIGGDTAENLGELADYDNHPADQGTDTFEKEKDVSVAGHWRGMIGRIDEALDKMERGTYGECDRCGREIGTERLDAVPYAIYCMECQDIVESQ